MRRAANLRLPISKNANEKMMNPATDGLWTKPYLL